MKGGTIVLAAAPRLRTGAWMMRGTIISLKPIRLLPTFSAAAAYNPTFLRMYARHLGALGFSLPYEDQDGSYQRYTGDTAFRARGRSSSGTVAPARRRNGFRGERRIDPGRPPR